MSDGFTAQIPAMNSKKSSTRSHVVYMTHSCSFVHDNKQVR